MMAGINQICPEEKEHTRKTGAGWWVALCPAKEEEGFTFIELIASLAILAFVLLGAGNLIIGAVRAATMARKTTLASNLCQAKIEGLKSLGYNSLSNSQESSLDELGNSGGEYHRTVTVATGPITDTKLITVTVTWADLTGTRTVSMRTMFANL